MFCDVTLLTGADVKTFQGESGGEKACIRRKRASPSRVCVSRRMQREGKRDSAVYLQHMDGEGRVFF